MHARDLKYKQLTGDHPNSANHVPCICSTDGVLHSLSCDDPTNPETRRIYTMCWKCHNWAPSDGGAVPSYGGGSLSQIAITHAQSRIKLGPLAATSCE